MVGTIEIRVLRVEPTTIQFPAHIINNAPVGSTLLHPVPSV